MIKHLFLQKQFDPWGEDTVGGQSGSCDAVTQPGLRVKFPAHVARHIKAFLLLAYLFQESVSHFP